MQRLRAYILERTAVRVAILGAVLGVLAIIAMPAPLRQALAFQLAEWLGVLLPAVILGGAVGWITLNKTAWWQTTLVAAIVSILIYVFAVTR